MEKSSKYRAWRVAGKVVYWGLVVVSVAVCGMFWKEVAFRSWTTPVLWVCNIVPLAIAGMFVLGCAHALRAYCYTRAEAETPLRLRAYLVSDAARETLRKPVAKILMDGAIVVLAMIVLIAILFSYDTIAELIVLCF